MKYLRTLFIFSLCLSSIKTNPLDTNGNGKCDQFCDLNYTPVCGTNEKGESRTFNNICILQTENCLRNLGFQKTGEGACP